MKRDEVVLSIRLPVAGDNDIQIINNLTTKSKASRDVDRPHPSRHFNGADELTEAAFYGREDVAALLEEGGNSCWVRHGNY